MAQPCPIINQADGEKARKDELPYDKGPYKQISCAWATDLFYRVVHLNV